MSLDQACLSSTLILVGHETRFRSVTSSAMSLAFELIRSDSEGGAPPTAGSSLGAGAPWVALEAVLLRVIVNG
jgi:hypothetical protein